MPPAPWNRVEFKRHYQQAPGINNMIRVIGVSGNKPSRVTGLKERDEKGPRLRAFFACVHATTVNLL